ncbi:MAG: ATP-binding cassette domain-containing protein [Okeania sp. SIO3I5]|uniref:ATP-binding cassette domain-containing protein n=1 Tax=Okeania sp. SIO3I5 TaxID=2607805 RepID=UPI0013B5DC1A|nr:ATP-binding cassette domain-containing protein [Okeania sp. SIO3I5]NEQ38423.1 ATP-binding cassette domain-containing protein [Okeania sp. SIO3I5]
MLILEDIYHKYKNNTVLNDINTHVKPGQILCLTGPSGCVKTTLLRIIAGLIKVTSGKVKNMFFQTSYVFQEPRLLPWFTTLENIAFGLKAKRIGKKQRQKIAIALARQLGIDKAANQYPHQLSGGMQQRVALGRALAVEPNLLLLDEPFSALDIGRRRDLQGLLLKLLSDRNMAAILVSHDLAEAVLVADKLIVLSPSPSQIVYEWQSDRPQIKRNEAYIYKILSQLLMIPEIATCFRLSTQKLEKRESGVGSRRK